MLDKKKKGGHDAMKSAKERKKIPLAEFPCSDSLSNNVPCFHQQVPNSFRSFRVDVFHLLF